MALELALLGDFHASLDEVGPVALPTRKTEMVLAYLALACGKPVPRKTLLHLFWGDRGEDQANNSLRQALSALRKALDGGSARLVVGRGVLTLDGEIRVDVLRFEDLVAERTAEALGEALDLYRGEFLVNADFPAAGFAEWRGREASRLQSAAVEALHTLLGSPDLADRDRAELTRRLHEIDPSASTPPPRTQPPRTQPIDKPSIVLLPFLNMSGDPEQEYFADGITEDLITTLSRLRWLVVITRNSSFTYKGRAVDARSISRELGARYVLEGSVRKAGPRVRITAQLIDATADSHIWAERYDRKFTDIFELQDELTAGIATALSPEITRAEMRRARQKRPDSLDAWDHYLRALAELHRLTLEANARAKDELGKALEIDAEFVLPHVALAWCHALEAIYGWSQRGGSALDLACRHGRAAVALDPGDADAHCALALAHFWAGRQPDAIAAARHAISLNANLSDAYGILGAALAISGDGEAGIEHLDRAIEASPHDPMKWFWYHGLANANFAVERYEDAIHWATRASEERPSWAFGHLIVAASAGLLGQIPTAESAMTALMAMVPRYSQTRFLRNTMWTREADIDRLLRGLDAAGLPR